MILSFQTTALTNSALSSLEPDQRVALLETLVGQMSQVELDLWAKETTFTLHISDTLENAKPEEDQ